ncbi:hypothetical protein [Curvibacter lanceolatus]|uniref:hypothetical protein n=1 Tax=Curvibacter lanceolatus TaxID=86182 RepID=UPI0003804C04|nr:hypothetical protein [Curvibacter lanceolatus]
MSTTPKAPELAADLTNYVNKYGDENGGTFLMIEAINELRRQHGEIEGLRAQVEALTGAIRDEMNEGLRLRELGGAGPDENITAFTERVICERDELRAQAVALSKPSTQPEMHAPKCPALDGGECICTRSDRHDPGVDNAWARFCATVGDGPDAPYPGMITSFERYYSQSFADKDWRKEASVWAAAWKAAMLYAPQPLTRPAVPEGWKLVPVEPTEDMLDAAHESDREYTLRNFGDVMTVMQGPWDHWDAMVNAAPQPDQVKPFQNRVQPWLMECFGEMIAGDREERNHRFLEEALELVQACGCTASEAHQLVDYTFGRPIGEPAQEVGGVMVTLAALCLANGLDMHANGETELTRITAPEMVKKIRAKQAAKPKYSPLPEAAPQPEAAQPTARPETPASADSLEAMERDAGRYRQLRRGQRWSVINGIGDTLKGDELDEAVDAVLLPIPQPEAAQKGGN